MGKKWTRERLKDGRVVQECQHSRLHVIAIPLDKQGTATARRWWSHACDGCCKQSWRDEAYEEVPWDELEQLSSRSGDRS